MQEAWEGAGGRLTLKEQFCGTGCVCECEGVCVWVWIVRVWMRVMSTCTMRVHYTVHNVHEGKTKGCNKIGFTV